MAISAIFFGVERLQCTLTDCLTAVAAFPIQPNSSCTTCEIDWVQWDVRD
jgi:hypothetical protein